MIANGEFFRTLCCSPPCITPAPVTGCTSWVSAAMAGSIPADPFVRAARNGQAGRRRARIRPLLYGRARYGPETGIGFIRQIQRQMREIGVGESRP